MPSITALAPIAALVVAIPLIVFWLWMFREMLSNVSLPPQERTVWILGFIFLNFLTAAYYFATAYNRQR